MGSRLGARTTLYLRSVRSCGCGVLQYNAPRSTSGHPATAKPLQKLTIMVDTLRAVPWTPPPVPLPEGKLTRRKPGPLYDLKIVQGLADGQRIYVATPDCDTELVENLEWDVDDVAKLIVALQPRDYHASEWCKGINGIVIDADAYTVRYDHIEERRGDLSHPIYYVKFGFRNNDPKLIILLFSCHLSRT